MTDPNFLLDANICIYLLEGDAPRLRARVEEREAGEVAASAVTFAEVMIGARRRDRITQAERFFGVVPVLLRLGHAGVRQVLDLGPFLVQELGHRLPVLGEALSHLT